MVVRRKPAPSPGVFSGSAHSARVAGAVCGSVHNAELSFRHAAAVGDRKHRQECLCHKASRKRGAVCSKRMILSGPATSGAKFFARTVYRAQLLPVKPMRDPSLAMLARDDNPVRIVIFRGDPQLFSVLAENARTRRHSFASVTSILPRGSNGLGQRAGNG